MTLAVDLKDVALIAGGGIGAAAAVIHGVLVQNLLVKPRFDSATTHTRPHRRLETMLLHFSTFNWFLGGLAIIAAAGAFDLSVRRAVCVMVACNYLFGAAGNFWATRGRHIGWAVYAVSIALIAMGWR